MVKHSGVALRLRNALGIFEEKEKVVKGEAAVHIKRFHFD